MVRFAKLLEYDEGQLLITVEPTEEDDQQHNLVFRTEVAGVRAESKLTLARTDRQSVEEELATISEKRAYSLFTSLLNLTMGPPKKFITS